MKKVDLKIGLTMVIVALVVLSLSTPFLMGITATLGRSVSLDAYQVGTDLHRSMNPSTEPNAWSGTSADGMNFKHPSSIGAEQIDSQMTDLMNEGQKNGVFGKMNVSGPHVEGAFVSTDVDQLDGHFDNYSIICAGTAEKVFDNVTWQGYMPTDVRQVGCVLKETAQSGEITIHNNPTAMMKYLMPAAQGTVNFAVDRSWMVGYENHTGSSYSAMIRLTRGTDTGLIMVNNGSLTIDRTNNRTSLNASVTNGQVTFVAVHLAASFAADEVKIMQAIADGKILGQMSLVMRNGGVVSEEQEYGDTSMIVQNNQDGQVSLSVHSPSANGKVVEYVIDKNSLNTTGDGIVASLNGVKMTRTTTDSVLAMNGVNNADAKYNVIDEGQNWKILAYIPHFTSQAVALEVVSSVPTSLSSNHAPVGTTGGSHSAMVTGGLVAVMLILIIVLIAAQLRRRR